MVDNDFYQIRISLSGILLDFERLKSDYNKYAIGLGHLQFTLNGKQRTVQIIANNDKYDWLTDHIGQSVVIDGAIRNFRQDNAHFNVIKIFDITEYDATHPAVNNVIATCKLLGLLNKPAHDGTRQSTTLYLLTNEKYDKHTRLTGKVLDKQLTQHELRLPEIDSVNIYTGYIQTTPQTDSIQAIELMITDIRTRKHDC